MMETMIDHLATSLGMDVEVVKVTNLYKNGHMTLVGKELTNCNMSRIWERELQCIYECTFEISSAEPSAENLYGNVHMILIVSALISIYSEMYQSAEVARRKKEISEYNKVLNS